MDMIWLLSMLCTRQTMQAESVTLVDQIVKQSKPVTLHLFSF